MHMHISTARIAEYVQGPALRIVVAQTDPKDQASFRTLVRDFVGIPSDHSAGEESAQSSAYHTACDRGGRCRAKTDSRDSCARNIADIAWDADRGRPALNPRVSFHERTLRDMTIVRDLGGRETEITKIVPSDAKMESAARSKPETSSSSTAFQRFAS